MLIAGGSGLLGSTVAPYLSQLGYEVIVQCRSAPGALGADLSDSDAALRLLDEFSPDVLINMVALTDVDACELNPLEAKRINVDVVANIVGWIRRGNGGCHLLQISTDQVYSGDGPHDETIARPINEYSRSKLQAEIVAGEVSSTIVRTNFFGRSRCEGRASLSDWVVKSLVSGNDITVFSDVLFDPLSLNTLAAMIGLMSESRRSGVFNLGSREGLSKAAFAFALAEILGLQTETMRVGESAGRSFAAPRPKDMRMNCSKFEATFGLVLPSLYQEIATMKQEYS